MKEWTEEQMYEAAGEDPLTAEEEMDAALRVAESRARLVARCLITKDFADLKLALSQELKHARQRKALINWMSKDGAYFDKNRGKWIVQQGY